MKSQLLVACFVAVGQCSLVNNIFARQSVNEGYLSSVCSPNVTVVSGATLPPCISVINIQGQCVPNSTDSLGYQAMSQCLCNPPSSFFADWLGCRQCLEYHGGLSEQALARYTTVISSISSAICTGTPTAVFADYFSSIDGKVGGVTTGATGTRDQAPSVTAVSNYYTPAGPQGPGVITGSATAATRSDGANSAATSGSQTSEFGTGSASGTGALATNNADSSTASASASVTSTSKSGAMPTAAFGFGLALALAGGALVGPF